MDSFVKMNVQGQSIDIQIVGGVPSERWPGDEVIKWSGLGVPPMVGMPVHPKNSYRGAPMKYFKEGWVEEYRMERGFLYALVRFPKLPKKYTEGPRYNDSLVWVAGVDLHTRDEFKKALFVHRIVG